MADTTDPIEEKHRAVELALQRFIDAADSEALHDLRVALRRLQTLFRCTEIFRTPVYESLSSLLKMSNRARDLEVFVLTTQQMDLSLPHAMRHWQYQLAEEIAHLQQKLPTAWQAIAATLPSTINSTQQRALALRRLHEEIERLHQRCDKLCHRWDDQSAHKLRINGKRIRYLLEAVVEPKTHSAQCVETMKNLQDMLGQYHDLGTLLTETGLENNELQQTITILEQEMRRLRNRFITDYCNKHHLHHSLHQAWQNLKHTHRKTDGDVV